MIKSIKSNLRRMIVADIPGTQRAISLKVGDAVPGGGGMRRMRVAAPRSLTIPAGATVTSMPDGTAIPDSALDAPQIKQHLAGGGIVVTGDNQR